MTSARWLDGDPGAPPPPKERLNGRNAGWRHFDAADILSMPDKWEYPWFAAWDLAFHAVTLAHVDPAFAKYQLLVHVPGVVPAPERRTARVRVVVRRRQPAGPRARGHGGVARSTARRDTRVPRADLPQAADELHVVAEPPGRGGHDLFSGGFLGLDNLSAFDRSHLPVAGTPRAVRRDGLDVRLLPVDAARWRTSCPSATRRTST